MTPVFTIGTTLVGFVMVLVWGAIPLLSFLVSPDYLGPRDAWDVLLFVAGGTIFMAGGWGLIRRRAWGWWLSVVWLFLAWLVGLVFPLLPIGIGDRSMAVVIPISFTIFFGGALALLLYPTIREAWVGGRSRV